MILFFQWMVRENVAMFRRKGRTILHRRQVSTKLDQNLAIFEPGAR